MSELLIPIIIFLIWTSFSILYIIRYKRYQLNDPKAITIWNNTYIFDTIPSVFPTLGIFCTALGITIGIWDFNTSDIEGSIPQLLRGLKLAFIATMAGIVGLIIFQKINAVISKQIEDIPNRPIKQTHELTAIGELKYALEELNKNYERQTDRLIEAIGTLLESKVSIHLESLKDKIDIFQKESHGSQQSLNDTLKEHFKETREDFKEASSQDDKNVKEIINTMGESNKLLTQKFDEFSELLSKNNTDVLVEVMKKTTEQFNSQMNELINRLVKENFQELNTSVNSLNDWQKQNKDQVQKLTENFKATTEMFSISATTLKEVANNTSTLTADNGKLGTLIGELNKVMIEDGKFLEITTKLNKTVDTLSQTTESFEETTSKLNDWVRTEKNFKEAADILIVKLEEFRDFNGDVWDKYRTEMSKSVSIIKDASTTLNADLETMNADFYDRLNDTLSNLDDCIQRFVTPNN